MDTSTCSPSKLCRHANSSCAHPYPHFEDTTACNTSPSITSSSSSSSSPAASPAIGASPQLASFPQNSASFQNPSSPSQMLLLHSSAAYTPPASQPSNPSGNIHASKKNSSGSSDEAHTYHAHIDDERVVEYDPSGRYGKGAYKVVWKALDFKDGYEVAWNCFQTTKQESTEFSQEIEILKRVRHPYIIAFRDAWYNNGEFVFITELITSGTLREYIQKLKKPDLKIVRSWTRQILNGLLYLHSHDPPIIHRDIKCDNIFINGAHGEVKIGDMGTAKMKVGKKYTVIGTPEFMAPEMYDERGYSEKVDVYAFGMCLLEMVTAEYPYSECKNAAQIYKKVTSGIKPECLCRVSDEMVLSLIQKCIVEESERISVREILEHPFFACEPELMLLGVDEARLIITLQVVLRSPDYTSFKFEFDLENDTAEEVVSEMIDEKVVPEIYCSQLTSQLNKQIRNFHQNFPLAMEVASTRRINLQNSQMSYASQHNLISPKSIPRTLSCNTPSSTPSQVSSTLPTILSTSNSQLSLHTPVSSGLNTIISPTSFLPSITTQLSSISLQPESLRSWKREAHYKTELSLAQKEALLAVERALMAEKKAVEIEKLMKANDSTRVESESLIESLKIQIKSLKGHHQHLQAQKEESKKNATVLEQSFVPTTLMSSGISKRSSSPPLSSSVITNSAELTPSAHESPYPTVHQYSTTQNPQVTHQQQLSATPPPLASIGCGNYAISTTPSTTSTTCTYPPDLMSIEELVTEVALLSQRSPDKAYEWITKLQMQDILTVGDLRQLHDADWANLNLTVFAMRALKNAVSRRPPMANKVSQPPPQPPVQTSHTTTPVEVDSQLHSNIESVEESSFSTEVATEETPSSQARSSPLLMASFGPSPSSAVNSVPPSDFDDYANSGCSFE